MRDSNNFVTGCTWLLAMLCICLGVAGFGYAKLHKTPVTTRVAALRWQYWINVERFKPVKMDTSRWTVPGDAYNVVHYESCSGSGEDRSCTSKARYTVDRWVYDHTLVNEGKPKSEMLYPDFTPSLEQSLGAVRESGRGKTYLVDFANGHTYMTNDFQRWLTFPVERTYRFAVNHFNEPDWSTLQEAS